MKKLSSLSLFFPAYNDAPNLPTLIKAADTIAKQLARNYEILIINDGSTDTTKDIVKHLQKTYPHLHMITHQKNKGYGGAIISGLTHTQYEWVFYTDGDGQYDVSELRNLVTKVSDNIDIVNGYKLSRNDTWLRKYIGDLYANILAIVYNPPIRDVDCDFRLMRKSSLKKIDLKSQSGLICLELVLKLQKSHATFAEVGVHHYDRKFGTSEFFRPKHLFKTFVDHVSFYFSTLF